MDVLKIEMLLWESGACAYIIVTLMTKTLFSRPARELGLHRHGNTVPI